MTLKGVARGCFEFLAPCSINNFNKPACLFLWQFMASRRRRRSVAYLLIIRQKEEERLKAYLARFYKECMTTNDQEEKIMLAALLGGIWPRKPFMEELVRNAPSTL